MDEIAILGVGAIGTAVAVALEAAGHRPRLCLRTPRDGGRVTCGDEGWILQGTDEAWLTPAEARRVRILFVATKAHQTEGAAPWLRALVGGDTTVVVLQNGVEHRERMAPLVPPEAEVVPAIVDLPATRHGGDVVVRRPGTIALGASGPERLFGEETSFLRVFVDGAFATTQWRKLCVNVVSGAIPTLTDRPAGVFRDEAVQAVARGLIEEARAVAAAEGVALGEDLADVVVAGFAAAPPDALNSMLLDRRAGRLLEADARHGAVVRFAARHGLEAPLNAMARALLGAMNR